VAVLSTDVLGNTGMESGELAAGVCARIRPSAVIAVDALAAGSLARLGCTVQLSDTGIAPGSGVGNARPALDRELLGVPVIGFGVPTVVDAATVARDLTGTDGGQCVSPRGCAMMVTPREVDLMIARASRLAAMSINAALQPDYSPADLIAAAV
jgi:spore protease